MTGLIDTRLFYGTNVTLGAGWLLQAKGWYTHQEIDAAQRQTTTRERPIRFPQLGPLFSYEELNRMAGPTYASASYGATTLFLKGAHSR